MTNPFRQPEAFWKLEFPFRFALYPIFEDYFAGLTETISSYELESKTVESSPTDLWCFEAYFEEKPDLETLKTALMKISNRAWDEELKLTKLENIDWVAQMHENFEPIYLGRFCITNPRHANSCDGEKIIIESSRAFGTGEHNTTKGCIEAMEAISIMDIKSIMDIGTGTGILAIAAAKIWPQARIVGSDIESVAVEISRQHANANAVEIDFTTIAGVPPYKDEVDLIVSNILKAPLIELAGDYARALKDGGIVVLSGFLDYQLDEVLKAYLNAGFEEVGCLNREKWITLTMRRWTHTDPTANQ